MAVGRVRVAGEDRVSPSAAGRVVAAGGLTPAVRGGDGRGGDDAGPGWQLAASATTINPAVRRSSAMAGVRFWGQGATVPSGCDRLRANRTWRRSTAGQWYVTVLIRAWFPACG